MAVPAWTVFHSSPLLHLDPHNHVLEDLVQSMADMEVAIGVWGPIVKDEWLLIGAVLGLPDVKIIGALAKMLLKERGVRTSTARSALLAPRWNRERCSDNVREARPRQPQGRLPGFGHDLSRTMSWPSYWEVPESSLVAEQVIRCSRRG